MTILSEEQTMLKDAATAWVRERAPVSAVRQLRTTLAAAGHDPVLYAEMVEMGWTGVTIPEAYGGYDFGYQSLGVVLEQLGRSLTVSPLISSAVTVASALVMGGSEAQKQAYLPGMVAGETIGALALEEGPRHQPALTALTAKRVEHGWQLNGIKRPVLDGIAANLFVVVARTGGAPGDAHGLSLFLCPADAPGCSRTALRQIDSRGDAVVRFVNVVLDDEAVIGSVGEGATLLEAVLDRSRVALASEMLGATLQAFETTIDYLKTRVQFGQLIGSFQALQHRAADMLGDIELTRSAVAAALAAIDADADELAELASLAKALAGKTMRHVAREMIQMHGGIGMTDEHDAGLYLKRAQTADMAFGNVAYHRERYAALVGV